MKINIFKWLYSPFLLLVFAINPANAQVQCSSPIMSPLTFGAVDSQSTQTDAQANFSLNCISSSGTSEARICVSIGPDRKMTNGLANLNFELYQDLNHSIIWGSQFGSNTSYNFDVSIVKGTPQTFNATLYGRVLAGQTSVAPGMYSKSYPDLRNDARVTVNPSAKTCNTNPSGSLYIPFTVKVPMIKSCQVTTIGVLDFGSVMSGSAPITASSSANLINVNCTKTTPYNIGLTPSNGDVYGMGVMKNSTATATIPYQLQSNASGKVWGNENVTSTTVGNGVARVGTGAVQGETVYATVPNTDVKPDTYSDTVTVHVNY